jgi:hypothetical protein
LNGAIVNLLRVRIGSRKKRGPSVPMTRFTVTPIPTENNPTGIQIKFTEHPAAPLLSDLVLSEIAITEGAVLSDLVKVDATTYTVKSTFPVAGAYKVTITKDNVSPAAKSFSITKSPVGPTPVGYWGVAYNHLSQPPTYSSGIVPPTEADILALTGSIHEITGEKRNMIVNFEMDETDWRAATGKTSAYPTNASGRAFFITKDWGAPLAIVSSGFPVHEALSPFTITINGVTYSGVLANGAPPQYDGTAYNFTFV